MASVVGGTPVARGITEVSPNFVSTVGDQLLKISANGLDKTKVVTIRVGNSNCDKVAWVSTSMLRCRLSPGVGGGLAVSVSDGAQMVLANAFSYSAPTVSYINPIRGSLSGYRLINVKGYDFGVLAGDQKVVIGQTACLECERYFWKFFFSSSNTNRTTWIDQNSLACVTPPVSAPGFFTKCRPF